MSSPQPTRIRAPCNLTSHHSLPALLASSLEPHKHQAQFHPQSLWPDCSQCQVTGNAHLPCQSFSPGQHGWSSQVCSCHSRVPGAIFSEHFPFQPMQRRCRSWEPSVQVTEQGFHRDHGDHCGGLQRGACVPSWHELARMVYRTAKRGQALAGMWDKYMWNGLMRVSTY